MCVSVRVCTCVYKFERVLWVRLCVYVCVHQISDEITHTAYMCVSVCIHNTLRCIWVYYDNRYLCKYALSNIVAACVCLCWRWRVCVSARVRSSQFDSMSMPFRAFHRCITFFNSRYVWIVSLCAYEHQHRTMFHHQYTKHNFEYRKLFKNKYENCMVFMFWWNSCKSDIVTMPSNKLFFSVLQMKIRYASRILKILSSMN